MLSMSFSISSWVYVDINSTLMVQSIWRGTSTGSTDSFILLSRGQNNFNFSVRNESNSTGYYNETALVSINESGWYYITGIMNVNNNQLSLHVYNEDGSFYDSTSTTGAYTYESIDELQTLYSYIGAGLYDSDTDLDSFFGGYIADIKIWDKSLTNLEIQDNYENCYTYNNDLAIENNLVGGGILKKGRVDDANQILSGKLG